MKRILLTYGLISAGILNAWMTIQYAFMDKANPNYKLMAVLGYTGMFLALLVVFWAIRKYRDQNNGITFMQGIQIGGGVSLISSAIYGVVTWFIFKFVDTTFVEKYSAKLEESVRNNKSLSPDQMAQKLEQAKAYAQMAASPMFQGVVMFFTVLAIGLLLTLIAAAILRRNRLQTN
jgi:flagellar biogenesis protein FliO